MKLPHRASHILPRQWSWRTGVGISLVLSTLGWLPLSTLWQRGYAQNFTAEEITNYAAAVLAIENIRGRAYAEISDLMTSKQLDVTRYDLRCLTAHSLELPRAVRSPVSYLLINYCNDAQKIVEDTGLTVQRFNSITVTHRQDEALKEQIQLEIAKASQ
ncbi:DUF4168 domain-containing protein [Leptothoe sp. PORK10 BA2]|uniref:DUF4168 domain-containing protein n=1 Tax=Leptothoe sp. PORK10 BA2 TaxID=3110254 RepID=UPI002B1F8CCF|nr:DUF4168 domain-containing protein [Leptothoe sp. PORK10 BA2]MEA5464480.1 DUF4168 domain-containing protein [Leptothoe sp. PORK10 BA2]